jgi:hypothetical protein
MEDDLSSLSPLAKKLGIKPGHFVGFLNVPEEATKFIKAECPEGVIFSESLGDETFDIILFWPHKIEELAETFTRLQAQIVPTGAIWAVMPKKKFAPQRGITFSWEEMQAAGLQTDLVDNKVATIMEQDYGTRFVIRKERRRI